MDLKILYGGLSKDRNDLIEDLIVQSPKNLEGSDLGQKVTRVGLKRQLKNPRISIVLLNETDYNKITTGLSDDRLVCVIDDDSIRNVFESKFGVSMSGQQEEVEEIEDTLVEEEEDFDLSDSTEDPSWEEILKGYEQIGYEDDDGEESLEKEVKESEESFLELEVLTDEEEELNEEQSKMLDIPEEDASHIPINANERKAMELVIKNLREQLMEKDMYLSSSVSKEEFNSLKEELNLAKEKVDLLTKENEVLQEDNKELEEETKVLDGVKSKFVDLLSKYNKQKQVLEGLKGSKTKLSIPTLKRRYPNITFITPLSSNSVSEFYMYIASRTDNFLFIDLTNNSYIDDYIKPKKLVRPNKWLLEGLDYRKTIADTDTHPNIRLITHVVHKLHEDDLLKVDWDKALGSLATENKVIINIGSIYDQNVLTVLRAIQNGVSVKGFVGGKRKDQRIGFLALNTLSNYGVLASEEVKKDDFGMITERF